MNKLSATIFVLLLMVVVIIGCKHDSVTQPNEGQSIQPANWVAVIDSMNVTSIVSTPSRYVIANSLIRTTDNGDHWSMMSIDTARLHSIVQASAVASSSGYVYTNGFYSPDQGDSWVNLANNSNYDRLFVIPGSPDKLYSAGYGCRYSTDHGANWTAVPVPSTSPIKAIFVSPPSGSINKICIGNLSGLYRSTNGGTTWLTRQIGSAVGSIIRNSANEILAGTDGAEIYKSSGSDSTMTRVFQDTTGNYKVTSLALYGDYVFAGRLGAGVMVSANGGTSWTMYNTHLANLTINCLTICNDFLYAGTSQGIYRTHLIP